MRGADTEGVRKRRGTPVAIQVDNGTEFTSRVVDQWAYQNQVALHFIERGKPTQNAFIESFNGKFRDECLNQNRFVDLRHARELIEAWRVDYNTVRPHSSLGYRTPEEFAAANGRGKDGGFATLENATRFPLSPAATTAALFRPLQWNQKPWELRYDWTKNGGQVTLDNNPSTDISPSCKTVPFIASLFLASKFPASNSPAKLPIRPLFRFRIHI